MNRGEFPRTAGLARRLQAARLRDRTARCDDAQRLQEVGADEQKRDAFEPSDLLETVVRERYSPPTFTP